MVAAGLGGVGGHTGPLALGGPVHAVPPPKLRGKSVLTGRVGRTDENLSLHSSCCNSWKYSCSLTTRRDRKYTTNTPQEEEETEANDLSKVPQFSEARVRLASSYPEH